MQESVLIWATGLFLLYVLIDWWIITPRYFVSLYITASALVLGLGLTL